MNASEREPRVDRADVAGEDADAQDADPVEQDGRRQESAVARPDQQHRCGDHRKAGHDHRDVEDRGRRLQDDAVGRTRGAEVADLVGVRRVLGRVERLCGDDPHQDHRSGRGQEDARSFTSVQWHVCHRPMRRGGFSWQSAGMSSADNTPRVRPTEPRQLGRAGRSPCGVAGLRRPTVPGRPELPVRRHSLRPAAARLGRRTAWRPPAVPHRHRHALARAARRAHDRSRLLPAVARRRPAGWQPRRRRRSSTSRPTSTPPRVCSATTASTSSSPASVRCRWLPNVAEWAQVVATCCDRAAGSSSGRATRCCGRSTSLARTGSSSTSPTSRCSTRSSTTSRAPTSTPTCEFRNNLTHSWNHGSVRSSPALLNVGMQVTSLVEHDSVPWDALPGQMTQDDAGEWRLTERPERLACSYTLQAVKV